MANLSAQIGNIGPFDIISFSWATQNAGVAGSSGGSTQAQVSDIVIMKQTDGNSGSLAQASAAGTPFDSATITMTADSGKVQVFQFSSVFIASYSIGGTNSPSESMDWNFAKVSINYSSQDDPSAASGGSWGGSLGQPGAS